ncbi:MAG: response regulator [Clostridiaceae bacterium]|nr:response regulator [Clostridiaceae bacterium]
MYTLILVEDDQLICDGLCRFFPWREIGFEFLAGFTDSALAWEFIRKTPGIDVVLTDICMPVMDGLELAEKIKHNYPQIWTCFLTAYQEFDYAYQAIHLNVKKYIIKSAQYNELIRAFTELKEELDTSRNPDTLPDCGFQPLKQPGKDIGEAILVYIQKDLKNANLQSVADQVGLHPAYLSRYFKDHFHENFIDYLTRVKMNCAMEMLRKQNADILSISDSLGYANEKNFSRAFKKYTGFPPGAYKRLFKKEGTL